MDAAPNMTDIRVFSGGAPQAVLRSLAPEFEKATGYWIIFTFDLVTAIQRRLTAGEKADVTLLPIPLLTATEKILPFSKVGRRELAKVGVGVIVHEGGELPDISTADALRRALLDARSVAFPDQSTPSGSYLSRMLTQLGIADAMQDKIIYTSAISGGGKLVANGEADLGLYLVSEVQAIKGVSVVGMLPPALQTFVVYGTAIPAYNAAPEAALAFIKFLTESEKWEQWKAAGFELVGDGS